jgi:hypothetical protein
MTAKAKRKRWKCYAKCSHQAKGRCAYVDDLTKRYCCKDQVGTAKCPWRRAKP